MSHYLATAYSEPMIRWRLLAAADVRRALFSSPSVDRPMCAKQHHTITQHGLCAHQLCINMCPHLCNTSLRVRTDLANRPTEPMLVSFETRYTKLWGNRRFLQSGSRQTTPVCVGVTCGSGISVVRVVREKRLR